MRYAYSRSAKRLGECVRKKKEVCASDPNCVQTKVGCRRRPSKRGSRRMKYYGPVLPNDIAKSQLFQVDGRKRSKKRSHKRKSKRCSRK